MRITNSYKSLLLLLLPFDDKKSEIGLGWLFAHVSIKL